MVTAKQKKEILDNSPWSYSRVNSYETCPRMFKLTYIDKKKREDNSFAEFGTFCHELLERYYNGELEFYELSQKYEDEYGLSVTSDFPPNNYVDLSESYYNQGKAYFDNFEGCNAETEVLGVEQKIDYKIGEHRLVGYIDLVLKQNNKMIIVDHKSKKSFTKSEKEKYLRQLYLYSGYIKEEYGEFPEMLAFNMFRSQDVVLEKFDEAKYHAARQWFCDTIDRIYQDTKYKVQKSQFFCDYICSVRKSCYVSRAHKKGDG